jgi:hypothetical protein
MKKDERDSGHPRDFSPRPAPHRSGASWEQDYRPVRCDPDDAIYFSEHDYVVARQQKPRLAAWRRLVLIPQSQFDPSGRPLQYTGEKLRVDHPAHRGLSGSFSTPRS